MRRGPFFYIDGAGATLPVEYPFPYEPSAIPPDRLVAGDYVEYLIGDRVSAVIFAVGTPGSWRAGQDRGSRT
jgi:hypothetical protein